MAVALGAKGVGLGRTFLYAQAAYGEKGAIRAIRSESPLFLLICDKNN
jgi:L-lactate dehydrogenase (cytochrome)